MLSPGQILQGRYRILHQLGSGGMGAVYEATDERFGDTIALKEIITDATPGAVSERSRASITLAFEREAKSLAKAKHEAIPYVRDYFTENTRQYIVMELVEGEDLWRMLVVRNAPFPVEDALEWMAQLLEVLDYLHGLTPPIIHRDIKPQNIKINARGRLKLLDFGIARSSDKGATFASHTLLGATLTYSPIEQIMRVIDQTFLEFILLKHKDRAEEVLQQDTDARCDIYSLGACFYHLLTNRHPIESTKRALEIWEGNPDPLLDPAEFNMAISPALSGVLLRAMAIDRENRYASAAEMLQALEAAITGAEAVVNQMTEQFVYFELPPTATIPRELMRTEVIPLEQEKFDNWEITRVSSQISVPQFEEVPSLKQEDWEITNVSSQISMPEIDTVDKKRDAHGSPPPNEWQKAGQTVKMQAPANLVSPPPIRKVKNAGGNRFFWLASAGLVLLLGIMGAGVVALFISNAGATGKPVSNSSNSDRTSDLLPTVTTVSTPVATPDITPVPEPETISDAISDSKTPKPAPTQNAKPQATVRPAQTPRPEPEPTVRPKPTPVPGPAARPTPRRTPKPVSDDCFYNARCK